MASVMMQVRTGASHDFDYEHPRLLGFLTFGLDRRVPLGIVEGLRLGESRKLKHAGHRQRHLIAL